MKEATSELNLALLSVILVGILIAFFYTTVWPSLKKSLGDNVNCTKAICDKVRNNDGTVNCFTVDTNNRRSEFFTCTWKG